MSAAVLELLFTKLCELQFYVFWHEQKDVHENSTMSPLYLNTKRTEVYSESAE